MCANAACVLLREKGPGPLKPWHPPCPPPPRERVWEKVDPAGERGSWVRCLQHQKIRVRHRRRRKFSQEANTNTNTNKSFLTVFSWPKTHFFEGLHLGGIRKNMRQRRRRQFFTCAKGPLFWVRIFLGLGPDPPPCLSLVFFQVVSSRWVPHGTSPLGLVGLEGTPRGRGSAGAPVFCSTFVLFFIFPPNQTIFTRLQT